MGSLVKEGRSLARQFGEKRSSPRRQECFSRLGVIGLFFIPSSEFLSRHDFSNMEGIERRRRRLYDSSSLLGSLGTFSPLSKELCSPGGQEHASTSSHRHPAKSTSTMSNQASTFQSFPYFERNSYPKPKLVNKIIRIDGCSAVLSCDSSATANP